MEAEKFLTADGKEYTVETTTTETLKQKNSFNSDTIVLESGDIVTFTGKHATLQMNGKSYIALCAVVKRGEQSLNGLIAKGNITGMAMINSNPEVGTEKYKAVNKHLTSLSDADLLKYLLSKPFRVEKFDGYRAAEFTTDEKPKAVTILNLVTGKPYIPTKAKSFNIFL